MANKDKKSTELQNPMALSSFEEMELWFDEFLPHRFMHPFKDNGLPGQIWKHPRTAFQK